jgi:glucose/arabinose dehydrogenase
MQFDRPKCGSFHTANGEGGYGKSSRGQVAFRTAFAIALIVVAGLETIYGMRTHAEITVTDTGPNPYLAAPKKQTVPTVKIAKAVGWPPDAKPTVVSGFAISAFADNLDHPRWLYVLPNGDVLVAETNAPPNRDNRKGLKGWFMARAIKRAGGAVPSANRIMLLRDADHDGVAEIRSVLLKGLNSPFGMTLIGNWLYVANTDAIVKFPYSPDATEITAPGEKVADLPAGQINHHWTKNIIASEDGSKLYATVGSNSNVGEFGMENELNRAAILEIDLRADDPGNSSRNVRLFASGLRNPNGLDWQPVTHTLWTVVNERDEIGDLLVPDYMTSVRDGAFYGWPYSYYGGHIDERVKPQDPEKVAKAVMPDYALGAHTASLGFVFYRANERASANFPARYRNGAFIGQHGSWNRNEFVGYKVTFVPFDAAGRPAGPMEDFVTGFLNSDGEAMGRPVGVVVDATGALLVADDVGNRIWRVAPAATPQS